MIKAGSPIAE